MLSRREFLEIIAFLPLSTSKHLPDEIVTIKIDDVLYNGFGNVTPLWFDKRRLSWICWNESYRDA